MQSRKLKAKEFKKEIKFILKEIRRNGCYINSNATGVLDSMAKLLAAAKNNNVVLNFSGGTKSGNGIVDIDLEKLLAQPTNEEEAVL